MASLRAWTLYMDAQHIIDREMTMADLSLEPTPESPPVRWWSGEGTLHFENLTWSGAQIADGMLMDIGEVPDAPNLEAPQVKARLAVSDESLLRLMSVDPGPLHLEVGWLRSNDYGATWLRTPRYLRGRLGRIPTSPDGGEVQINIESYLDDLDRGNTVYWSAATHPDYAQMTELGAGLAFNFPLFE